MKTFTAGLAICAALGLAAACGARAVAVSPAPAPTAAPAPATAAPLASVETAPTVAPTAEPPKKPERAAPFPPPDFGPLVDKTKVEGDGVWAPIATGDTPPTLYRAMAHPHAYKQGPYVVVVAIDLARIGLGFAAGMVDPPPPKGSKLQPSGLVPEAEQADLIATFNGGFMTKHGHYGVLIDGVQFVPARDYSCVVGFVPPAGADAGIRIGSWRALAPIRETMRTYRQTPLCLLEDGAIHPDIDSDVRPRAWSASAAGEYDVRRTALGLDATNTILYFALGEWVTPHNIADAMKAAGAKVAAQLDINWGYTRFLFYGRKEPDAPLRVMGTLIPNLPHAPRAYVHDPAERDFFWLKRRQPTHPPD